MIVWVNARQAAKIVELLDAEERAVADKAMAVDLAIGAFERDYQKLQEIRKLSRKFYRLQGF